MSTKKDAARPFGLGTFFVVDGTGLEQQRRRPPPAAETGSRGWGRVLIFQSPAKGLRKNQQTQPVQAPAVRFRQGSQRLGMSTKKDVARPFGLGTFFVVDGTGLEQRSTAAGGATNTPVGCLLVRGSQRLGMSTGMTAVLWWAVQDENRNKQRQGITMTVVSCLLLILTVYGILGSVQQIGV